MKILIELPAETLYTLVFFFIVVIVIIFFIFSGFDIKTLPEKISNFISSMNKFFNKMYE